MQYLSTEEILRLHFQVINDYGGSHGVRDEARLQSVALAPRQTVFGQEQYPGLHHKAAVYLRNIIADHPFVDGNKRTAVTAAGIFLLRNNHTLTCPPQQLEDLAVRITVEHLEIPAVTEWLKQYSATNSLRKI